MITLVPVFDSCCGDFLDLDGNEPVLGRVFETLREYAGSGGALVVSDREHVLALARSMGLGAMASSAPPRSPLPVLDHETRRWLLDLLPGCQEAVLIVDVRNPLIDADLLADFAARFREDPSRSLISVRAPVDHPCQTYWGVQVLDAGSMVVLRDGGGDILASRHMPPDILPVDRIGLRGPMRCERRGGLVRLIVRRAWLERTLGYKEGVVGLALDAAGGMFLALHEDRGRLLLTWPDHGRTGRLSCKLYFPVSGRSLEVAESGPLGNGAGEALRPDELARETLAVLIVLREVLVGGMDFQSMYEPSGADWHYDREFSKLKSRETGQVINGRQAFPPVYEGEGSLLAVDPRVAPADDGLDHCRCHVLDRGRSLCIRTELDMLRLEAKQRAGTA